MPHVQKQKLLLQTYIALHFDDFPILLDHFRRVVHVETCRK